MKKKLLHFAYVGAIALIGIVGFSACSDDVNELENGSKVTDVTTEVKGGVPVNFVFNVSTTPASTRMNADAVQATGTSFRGINKAQLIAYKLSTDGKIVTNPGDGTGSTEKPEKVFAEFTSLMDAKASFDNLTTSHRVLEMSMPQGTNTLLFYGTAPYGGSPKQHGLIEKSFANEKVEDLTFAYSQRISGTTYERFKQVGSLIAAFWTGLVDTGFKSNALENEDKDLYFWWDTTTNQASDALKVSWRPSETTSMAGTPNSFKDYELFYGSPQRVESGTSPSPAAEWVAKHMTSGALDSPETATMKNTRIGTDTSATPEKGNVSGHTYMLIRSDVTWKAYGKWVKGIDTNDTGIAPEDRYPNEPKLSSLGSILGDTYNRLTEKNLKELRAASSAATLATIKDLYSVINKVATATPTTMKEYVADQFANRIISRINKYVNNPTGVIAWNNVSTIVSTISAYATAANNPITTDLIQTDDHLTGFPYDYNIPAGASLMDFTYNYPTGSGASTVDKSNNVNYGGLFSFMEKIPNYDLGGAGDGTTYVTQENYVYPAELMYFGNSPVRVTDKQLAPTDYPDGSNNWITPSSWTSNNWSSGASHVDSETKSVAMMNNINYGVALLETRVKIVPNASDKIYDNSAHFYGGDNKSITVGSTTPFELKGIIIGGQPKKVGWDYTATSASGMDAMANWDRLVYDDVIINGSVSKTSGSGATPAAYTLLLDNYSYGFNASGVKQNGAQNDQGEVYIALEFENNAGDFMGQHNMVRNGGRFYLIGKVDPKAVKTGDTKKYYETVEARGTNDNYVVPPYNNDGTSKGIGRVFMQDYKTTITFYIGEYSLQYAYVTVPNLQTSQVSLGLSVDVTWQTGINFGDVVLGGTVPVGN